MKAHLKAKEILLLFLKIRNKNSNYLEDMLLTSEKDKNRNQVKIIKFLLKVEYLKLLLELSPFTRYLLKTIQVFKNMQEKEFLRYTIQITFYNLLNKLLKKI